MHNINLLDTKVSVSNECAIRKHKHDQIAMIYRLAFLISLRMGNGATPFGSIRDATIGTHICIGAMPKPRRIAHVGKGKKASKTKAISPA